MDTEENYGLLFSKLVNLNTFTCEDYSKNVKITHGIWVDIFPYDNLPNDMKLARKHFNRIKFLNSLLTVKLNYKAELNSFKLKLSYYIVKFITLFIPKNYLKSTLKKRMKKYNNVSCNNIIVYGCTYPFDKEIRNKNLFEELVKYDFEDTKFYSFKNYDKYLKEMYNDYMTLPPENKRKIHVLDFEIKKTDK